MQAEFSLLTATVYKLAQKMQEQNYINFVQLKNDIMQIKYSNGFKQSFKLASSKPNENIQKDYLVEYDLLKKNIDSFTTNIETKVASLSKKLKNNSLKELLGTELEKIQSVLEVVLIEKLTQELQKLVDILPRAQDGVDGRDGKDANEEAIKQYLTEIINSKLIAIQQALIIELKKELDKALKLLPVAKDGVDGRDGKDGVDGKDADQGFIIAELTKALNEKTTEQQDALKQSLQDGLNEVIASIPSPKNGVDGRDGTDGTDGQDADEEAIWFKLQSDLQEKLSVVAHELQKHLENFISVAIEKIEVSFKPAKGDRGLQGKQGKQGLKGDRGSGIKSVEIDASDHLIIKTDDKVIDAGEISKKIFGGGLPSYTNSLPMPSSVGGLPAGTTFDNIGLNELLTGLLYGYQFPTFTIFTIAGLPEQVEVGYKIQAGEYEAAWTITNPQMLQENSIGICYVPDNLILASDLTNSDSPINLQIPEITIDSITPISFEISAYNTTGTIFKTNLTPIKASYRIFYGEYLEEISADEVKYLRANELTDSIMDEYLFLDVGYKWFCYPEGLGENYLFYDVSSDIAVVMDEVKKIDITNEYGLTITYNCYRTFNELHHQFIMGVK